MSLYCTRSLPAFTPTYESTVFGMATWISITFFTFFQNTITTECFISCIERVEREGEGGEGEGERERGREGERERERERE